MDQYGVEDERNRYTTLFRQFLNKSLRVTCLCNYVSGIRIDTDFGDNIEIFVNNNENNFTNNNETSCNMSCFYRMAQIYDTLKKCFNSDLSDPTIDDYENESFRNLWSKCILSKVPHATNHVGYTIFHQAASDNNFKLLKSLLSLYPEGIHLTDSKGMNILNRASQRNFVSIVEYLLTEMHMDPNGSRHSVHTPLLISITSGYDRQAELLLRYGASPSQIETAETVPINNVSAIVMSPLRTTIIYERFQIMYSLLRYGANIYELFPLPVTTNCVNTAVTSNDYCLKLLFRHLNETKFKHMIKLNEFVLNVNVYKFMFISFIKSNFQDYVDTSIDSLSIVASDYSTVNLTFTETLLFEYLNKLIKCFYAPKTLKELCRFKIRDHICNQKDRQFSIIENLNIPKTLKLYLLHE